MSQRNSTSNSVASHILVLCQAADRVWMGANSAYQRDERRPGNVPEFEAEMGVLQQLARPCRKEAVALDIPFLEAERRVEELLLSCQPLLTWTPTLHRWKPGPAPDQLAWFKEMDDIELGKMTARCRNAIESVRRMADALPTAVSIDSPPRRAHGEYPLTEELVTGAQNATRDDSTDPEVDEILVAAKALQQQEKLEQDKRDKAQAVQEAVDNALRQFSDDVSAIFRIVGTFQLRGEELPDGVVTKYLHAIFDSLAEACRVVRTIGLDRLWNEIDRKTLSHFGTNYTKPAEANLQFNMGRRLLDRGFADKLTYQDVEKAWSTFPLRGSYHQAWMILSDLRNLRLRGTRSQAADFAERPAAVASNLGAMNTGHPKKRAGMTVQEANAKAMGLAEKLGERFFALSGRKQARQIGCSWETWSKTDLYKEAAKRSKFKKPQKTSPKTVSLTDKLESVIGNGVKDQVLMDLIAEHKADGEPSPLDDDDPNLPRKVRLRKRL